MQRFRRKGAFIQARDNRMPAAELPGSKTVQKKQPKASVRGLVSPNRLARLDAPLHGRRRAGPPKSRPLKGRPPSWEFGSQWVAHRSEQSGHFSDEERCPALLHMFQILCQLHLPFLTQLSVSKSVCKKTEIFTLPCFHWYDSCLWEFDYFLCEYCSCLW